jgi:hypothetical protein
MTTPSPRARRALVLTTLAVALASALVGASAASGAAPGPARERVIVRFAHPHSVHSTATARRFLAGTTRPFKRFAARYGAEVRREDAGCQRNSGIYVQAFTRGYAYGAVGACGGYIGLWTDHVRGGAPGGRWREVWGSQDGWYCPPLKRYRVPSALVGDSCWSPSRHAVIAYHQP